MAAPIFMVHILNDVIEEHAEEAAILWLQRDQAVRSQDYGLEDLVELDNRIEAHLDGLRIARDSGWDICKELGWAGPGEFFVAMSLAIDSDSGDRVMEVLSEAGEDVENGRGIVSALGWTPATRLQGIVKMLLNHESPQLRGIALSACAAHRVNPQSYLSKSLQEGNERLQARALRCLGELGLTDYLPEIRKHMNSGNDLCRFWSAWSAVLLGDESAIPVLKSFVNFKTDYCRLALQLAVRVMDLDSSRNWIKGMAGDKELFKYALLASGYVGDPVFLPAIIKQMESDEYACVAGEAFSMITGVDLDLENLGRVADESEQPGEEETDESDDESREPDIEQDLLMPDVAKISAWWDQNKHGFNAGQRYLAGKPLSEEHCQLVLRGGSQMLRFAAALELVLAKPGTVLFETRAPGYRQQNLLGI